MISFLQGVTVLGAVLNFAESSGFNSKAEIEKYFEFYLANNDRPERLYGVVPCCPEMTGLRERIPEVTVLVICAKHTVQRVML